LTVSLEEEPMIRWGIVGPGGIANRFAEAMTLVDGGQIVAVSSRSVERAENFCERFGVRACYGDYESLAADESVDAVYVATPHARHEVDTVMMLRGGKHVLCEKPFALNARQAERMADEARARNLFLMEAMWSRFLPAYLLLAEIVESGEVGEIVLVESEFGFRLPVDPDHRLYPVLGGGGLLDLGIYPLQLCSLLLGHPEHVQATGVIRSTGVDEMVAALLSYEAEKIGIVKAAIAVQLKGIARVSGTKGSVTLPPPMHCPSSLTVASESGFRELDCTFPGNGMQFEIEEVQRCISNGVCQSQTMGLEETLSLASTLDAIRREIGLVYPDDEDATTGESA
jgi:predicted dehydrogenase